MGRETGISWTEATWNPWMGCTKVSPGCDHCYMFREQRQYGNDPELVRRSKTKFREPVAWQDGRLIFTCSWSDWFHEAADAWRPEAWEIIRETPRHTYQILTKRPGRILRCLPDDWGDGYPNVWLGVSIESARFNYRADQLRRVPAALRFISAEPLLGSLFPSSARASTPEQVPAAEMGGHPAAAGRKPASRTRDAAVTTPGRAGSPKTAPLSEPATEEGWSLSSDAGAQGGPEAPRADGPPDLDRVMTGTPGGVTVQPDAQGGEVEPFPDARGPRPISPLDLTGIGWVIVGGESGPRAQARPMHPEWAREIRDACQVEADARDDGFGEPLPFHFKQWGSWAPDPDGHDRMGYMGPQPKAGGKRLDGVEWCEIPARPEPAVTALF